MAQELGRRWATEKISTVDLDATIIESWKRESKVTYDGKTGYQPKLALWAEMNVVLTEEFRDGNVPAHQGLLSAAKRAFQAPTTVVSRRRCWTPSRFLWRQLVEQVLVKFRKCLVR